jgi:hypothetical protein
MEFRQEIRLWRTAGAFWVFFNTPVWFITSIWVALFPESLLYCLGSRDWIGRMFGLL